MEELWKPIVCLRHSEQMTAQYEASNLGRIRNKRTKLIVAPHLHNTGYLSFNYRYKDENGKTKYGVMLWHRVIALTWIPNPTNLPQIDHIDRNVENNCIDNLRWASAKDNAQNQKPKSHIRYSRNRETRVIDRNGNVIETYPSLIDACNHYGVRIEHALEMLHGRRPAKKWGTFQQDPFDKEKK